MRVCEGDERRKSDLTQDETRIRGRVREYVCACESVDYQEHEISHSTARGTPLEPMSDAGFSAFFSLSLDALRLLLRSSRRLFSLAQRPDDALSRSPSHASCKSATGYRRREEGVFQSLAQCFASREAQEGKGRLLSAATSPASFVRRHTWIQERRWEERV